MKIALGWVMGLASLLCGCAKPGILFIPPISSVTPSVTGIPNSVVSFGNYEFVSIQGTGQIVTYDISGGKQLQTGAPYATPCADPSGMVIASIAGANVMAVACYDTGSLLTLTVNANGSLSALGIVDGLELPYPGIVLDGTNVLVPLFGTTSANGAVAKVSIATPTFPVIEGIVTLAIPVSGGIANGEYLAVSGGYIYVTAGSESNPLGSSSTVQVVNEAAMTLVGSPLAVAHSPQQIAVQGNVAYVTLYDATQLESIDVSNPANLQPLQVLSLTAAGQSCHALPVVVRGNLAYVGCYSEGAIIQLDISDPARMQITGTMTGVPDPQRLTFARNLLLSTDSSGGGEVYQLNLADF